MVAGETLFFMQGNRFADVIRKALENPVSTTIHRFFSPLASMGDPAYNSAVVWAVHPDFLVSSVVVIFCRVLGATREPRSAMPARLR